MTIEDFFDFIHQNFDKPNVGNTPENKGQCVGLVSVYQDALGITHEWGNAKDFLTNADTSKFEVIPNAVALIPSPGDILVYGSNYGGGDGHVAICVWASQMKLCRFEENNPAGSNPLLNTVNYDNNVNGLLGWIHPLNGLQSLEIASQIILDQSDAFIAICTKLNIGASKDLVLAEIDKLITIEDSVPQKDKQLTDANVQINRLGAQITTLQQEHDSLMAQATLQAKTIQDQDNQIKYLSTSVQELKNQLQQPIINGWQTIISGIIKLLHGK